MFELVPRSKNSWSLYEKVDLSKDGGALIGIIESSYGEWYFELQSYGDHYDTNPVLSFKEMKWIVTTIEELNAKNEAS